MAWTFIARLVAIVACYIVALVAIAGAVPNPGIRYPDN